MRSNNVEVAPTKPGPSVDSPCVQNCCLNQQDLCLGCFRLLDEITGWRSYTDSQREQVLDKCLKRKNLADR